VIGWFGYQMGMNLRFLLIAMLIPLCFGCEPKSLAPQVVREGVRFSYSAPTAKSVSIAGSFNHWNPNHARLTGPSREGIWTIVLPLSAGQYEYRFVINGKEWVLDPSVPSVDDGLGDKNSVLFVEP
jgi:1,4-alpha-glucan branching enzyme